MSDEVAGQESERKMREDTMKEHRPDREQILRTVARHHCLRVMSERARQFRSKFRRNEWILDLGCGTGWYWSRTEGAGLILADFSLETLRVARQLLTDADRAVFLWTNAQKLPIRESVVSGLWSIQVFQHFPAEVLEKVQTELDRVLNNDFMIEIYNLNPAWLHKAIYRLFGKRLHCRGQLGEMELNRLSVEEWEVVWRNFRQGHPHIASGYSELFFHPNFHLRPRRYPIAFERALAKLPGLAALFARQSQIHIDARVKE